MTIMVVVTIVRVIPVMVPVPVVSVARAIASIMVASVTVAVVTGVVNAVGQRKARGNDKEQTDGFHLLDFQGEEKALPIRRVVM